VGGGMSTSSIKIYEYKTCSTCQKALKYLDKKELHYERFPIVEQPPTLAELEQMLGYLKAAGGSFKSLFNTSGLQYRELKVADKIKAGMTEAEAVQLLSKNGKLIKRPFLLAEDNGTVGFNEAVWSKLF
jgi:arsenate reductase (glutaredoxin)